MRASSLTLAFAPLSALAQGINITETNEVDLANGTGNLGWGATDLPFGYSAGVGFNFAENEIGGGFNGAVPGQAEGAFGCGYTVNSTNVVLGLGATLGNQSIGVEVVQDKTTGAVKVVVNGKEVTL
ncbi:hypothetical protein N0V93_009309 [Gnomoniopsis smithogilvyi]|uniref:Uncharacterized protein n=1 Tax=Gnomoniopsis smithogilvyi TaxID=1191159 RepID=A0A9W9CTP2_9PEZI|nr:hypothetical protein N0V93_009309 [Gnomoniopsis smithogilvyi]